MISARKGRRVYASRRVQRPGPVTSACCVLLLTTVTTSLSSSASTPAAAASSYSFANYGRPLSDISNPNGPNIDIDTNNCPRTIISPGLKNLGNICYMNSQLECAFHIPRIRRLVLNKDDDDIEIESEGLVSLRQVFTEMLEQSSKSELGASAAASPRPLCQSLQIPIWQQQDAQEFWKLLLPALQRPKLIDLYQGAFEDYIRALDGSQCERLREETFLDLSLDLVAPQSSDMADYDILDSFELMFQKPELLSAAEGNGWKPEKGATPIDAEKGARLKEHGLPSILQLHLKRFQYDWQTDTMKKVNTPCKFPLKLDLNPLLADPTEASESRSSENALYDLQSVVVHVGEYGVGHYYSYVRPDVRRNEWYRFNDDQVAKVDVSQVLQDAYGGVRTINSLEGGLEKYQAEVAVESSESWWQRPLAWLFPASQTKSELSSGYGGLKGSAYVLQYVRRRDIPQLYQLDDDGEV